MVLPTTLKTRLHLPTADLIADLIMDFSELSFDMLIVLTNWSFNFLNIEVQRSFLTLENIKKTISPKGQFSCSGAFSEQGSDFGHSAVAQLKHLPTTALK